MCVLDVRISKGLWDSTQFGISHHVAVLCRLEVCAELEPIKLLRRSESVYSVKCLFGSGTYEMPVIKIRNVIDHF